MTEETPAQDVLTVRREKLERLRAKGIDKLRLERSLSPPWTTDWISAEGKRKLLDYGIAPPGPALADGAVPIRIVGRRAARR